MGDAALHNALSFSNGDLEIGPSGDALEMCLVELQVIPVVRSKSPPLLESEERVCKRARRPSVRIEQSSDCKSEQVHDSHVERESRPRAPPRSPTKPATVNSKLRDSS